MILFDYFWGTVSQVSLANFTSLHYANKRILRKISLRKRKNLTRNVFLHFPRNQTENTRERERETGGAFKHGDAAFVERVIEGVHEIDLDRVRLVRKRREFSSFHLSLSRCGIVVGWCLGIPSERKELPRALAL
jgi:hypothetical protein